MKLEGLKIVRARGKYYVYRRATGEKLVNGFAGNRADLAVGFQEVVHLVRTEEAEVAKLQCSTERPDEQP
ncbi:hypothetical protein [Bradyrhizobium sp. Ash2021]|uniref:hypothetical protein n=1 Tax=Bradyrhizobium sp. Ash2021 TaxID=2954771 RepID=UPI0028156A16|nr:hypothetical protein [Bradyrhizobium sp. Ash2021]WMT72154.1 hypothetical protein NL528_29445 [Bradyrhizobium sp. Ash2021]